jgi:outer membrane autotransporter protein
VFVQQVDNQYRASVTADGTALDPAAKGRLVGFQTGLDLLQSNSESGHQNLLGLYLGYSNANTDANSLVPDPSGTSTVRQYGGNVNMNAWSLGAYWTHYGPQGGYVDVVAQATNYSGSSDTQFASLPISGKGIAASIEGGYPMAMNQTFSLIPEAQVIWQRVRFDQANDGQGDVALGNSSGITGRLGVKGKWKFVAADGRVDQPYFRVNYWREWGGDSAANFTSLGVTDNVSQRSAGTQYMDVEGGYTTWVNNQWSAFVDAGYQFSVGNSDRRNGFKATWGLRYQFQ